MSAIQPKRDTNDTKESKEREQDNVIIDGDYFIHIRVAHSHLRFVISYS